MSVLRICLLGQVRIAHADSPSPVKVTYTVQALLAYLLLQRQRSHPRETLAGLFWGDHSQERARRCLNTTLWRLRQVLEPDGIPHGTYLLTVSPEEVGFNPESDYWLDVAVFEEQSCPVLAKPVEAMQADDARTLEGVVQLYTGELLEGFYDDWALRERERLRRMYLNCLAHLMGYYKHQQAFQESLLCGQRILDQDPLREEIQREMMRLYLANGQRALAVRQYELCRQVLATELDIPPMEETQALYAEVLGLTSASQLLAPSGRQLPVYSQAVVQQLRLALQDLNEAHTQLGRAVQLLEHLVEH
jgi:DNA-binding SARP family transcriptional activator